MSVTLADLAENAQDKLVQGFINEIITDSFLLSAMTFDDCLNAGRSDLVYSYKRITELMTAKFRALNSEPEQSEIKFKRITTSPGILSDSWKMDRVAKRAAEDLYAEYVAESKNAIIRKFNATVINGDTKTEKNGFDGLSKALTGTSTEFKSAVDLSAVTKEKALAFASEMDVLLGALHRDPDAIIVAPSMYARINAVCRELGISNVTMDGAGHRVSSWDGIRIEQLRDGAMTTNDVYAVCFGMEDFHGITLSGGEAISVHLPDWSSPGAVKSGDAEFVCGCALRKTKSAAVLRAYVAPQGGGSGGGSEAGGEDGTE